MRHLRLAVLMALVFAAVALGRTACAGPMPLAPKTVQTGGGVVSLTGPWWFSTGDNPGWSSPGYDDQSWEKVDLTPKPNAHDADVGLSGYVPGWSARGHAGYSGFGWYRLQVNLRDPIKNLALAAPTLVDSAYEIYWDGRRIGGIGDFSKAPPVAFGIRPMIFKLGDATAGPRLIAIRAWMDAAEAGSQEAGGLHVAPALGASVAIIALNRRQASVTFEGYVVDAAELLAFLILAVWSLTADLPRRPEAKSIRLAAALVLTALLRINQPIFFWTSWESLHAYDLLRSVIETPAVLAVWMVAFQAWLSPPRSRFTDAIAVSLGVGLCITQLFSRSWVNAPGLSSLKPLLHGLSADLRFGFVAIFAWLLGWAATVRRWSPTLVAALASALLVGIALFAEEISRFGVKGVWFPLGIGVSRTQFAFAAAILTLAVMTVSNSRQRRRRQP